MTVLHVSTPKSWRGGEQQMAYLILELKKLGITSHVCCNANSEVEKFCISNNISYKSTPEVFAVNPVFAAKLNSYSKQIGADLIHVHDSHAHTFAVMAASIFGNKLPIVVSRRVDFPISKSALSRYKYNHSQVESILCVSDAIKAIMHEDVERPERLKTVYSGIDLEKFPHYTGNSKLRKEFNINSKFLIGNVAALAPHKDYRTFISTAALLIKEYQLDAHFVIIGNGPLKADVEQWVEKSGISKHITMTGFRSDVHEILPELNVFLITSETEGLGTSILDAFACKVPVVATAAGGIPEIVHHNKTGLLAPIKDYDSLAELVHQLVKDESLQNKLVTGASQLLQQFTKESVAEQTKASYEALLS